MAKMKIFRTFIENSQKRKYSENSPRIRQQVFEKLSFTKLVENHFPKVYTFFVIKLGQSFLAFCNFEYSTFLNSVLTFFLEQNNRKKQTRYYS